MTNKISIKIETLEEKKLVGMHQKMSSLDDKTIDLFRGFMPRRKEIIYVINKDVLDLKVYPENYFLKFNPSTYFIKWALVEVSNLEHIPQAMEFFVLPAGKYAVFIQKRLHTDHSIFKYIYTEWIPNSDYMLDGRPHFDVLGEKTQPQDPNSEQHIWIPIKSKKKANS
jgi:AraC family transcriptional regulator